MPPRPRLEVILDNLFDGVYAVDRERRITYWNKAAERLTGYPAQEVIGRRCNDNVLCHVDDHGQLLCSGACALAMTMVDGQPREKVVFLRHKHGHRVATLVRIAPIRADDGNIEGAVEVMSDHTRAMEALETTRKLERDVFVDPVTGLANRRALDRRVRGMVAEGGPGAMILLDIDSFKSINDGFGHGVGDRALELIAQTLVNNTRSGDVVGRWGGDEFMVLLPNADGAILTDVANRIRSLVERSLLAHSEEAVRITVSVGGALLLAGDDARSWTERADCRLYESKRMGRNRVTVDPPVTPSGFVVREGSVQPTSQASNELAVPMPALRTPRE